MKTYRDIAGDGGSRIVEQVVAQRARIERQLAEVRFLVAVGSGKGGVGKSTLTHQLGAALAHRGRSVAIFDADLNGPTQARMGGLRDRPFLPGDRGMSLPSTTDGLRIFSLGQAVPEDRAVDFDSVAEGDSHTWRATREFSLFGEMLGAVDWGRLDLLLFDLPPGAERTFQYAEYLGPRTAFVLVTLPSDLARGVVARSLAALRNTPNRVLGYIRNMQGYRCPDCDEIKPLFPESTEVDLGIPCLGSLPFDPRLATAADCGQSRVDREDVTTIATRLMQQLEGP